LPFKNVSELSTRIPACVNAALKRNYFFMRYTRVLSTFGLSKSLYKITTLSQNYAGLHLSVSTTRVKVMFNFIKKSMKQKTKIAILGGTGKSGRYLVAQLIERGFQFKILLRNPEKFQIKSPFVEVVKGDARDYSSMRSLVMDCEAVISTLGQPLGEPPIFSQATTNIIQAIKEFKMNRYILVTGLSIDVPLDKKSASTQMKSDWMRTNFPQIIADRQSEYHILEKSIIDWTLVRLPLIEQTNERDETIVSLQDCLGDKISAADLAIFLINQLTETKYIRKSPFIANP
jgi:putative NADH-flavin reductase